jgi:hypothetical protein
MQQGRWLQCGHIPARRSKGDQDTRHTRRARGFAIRVCIANQHALPSNPARTAHGFKQMLWIRLAHRQAVRPQHRAKSVPDAKPRQQRLRQPFWFVCANRHAISGCLEVLNRRHRTGVKHGVAVNVFGIGRQ